MPPQVQIDYLTPEQELKVQEYYDKFFKQATCTDPADRQKAEKAALRLAEIGDLKVSGVFWVAAPISGEALNKDLWNIFRDVPNDALSNALINPRGVLNDNFSDAFSYVLRDLLWDTLWKVTNDALEATLRSALDTTLNNILNEALYTAFRKALCTIFWGTSSDTLKNAYFHKLWNSGWLVFYIFCRDILGVEYSERSKEILNLYEELYASCFALWFIPGTVILCEHPKKCAIIDGKLIDIKWRDSFTDFHLVENSLGKSSQTIWDHIQKDF